MVRWYKRRRVTVVKLVGLMTEEAEEARQKINAAVTRVDAAYEQELAELQEHMLESMREHHGEIQESYLRQRRAITEEIDHNTQLEETELAEVRARIVKLQEETNEKLVKLRADNENLRSQQDVLANGRQEVIKA